MAVSIQEFAQKIKDIAGNQFISLDNYDIYCYNGEYWVNNNIPLRRFIRKELSDYYENHEHCIDQPLVKKYKKSLNNLHKYMFVNKIIKQYITLTTVNTNIRFDARWWLFGFNNVVYNLKTDTFQRHEFDDYLTTRTGYYWKEPNNTQLETVQELINKIMPIIQEQNLLLYLLCTALEGRTFYKIVIFYSDDMGGKTTLLNLLYDALGEYSVIGHNGILCRKVVCQNRCDPEISSLDGRRMILFNHPYKKLSDASCNFLTNGLEYNSKSLYEKVKTRKLINTTFIDTGISHKSDMTITLNFRSIFTDSPDEVDGSINTAHIYPRNITYSTHGFREKHKCALLKILFGVNLKINNISKNKMLIRCFDLPLELCYIIQQKYVMISISNSLIN
jgi:hypothetical protein